MLEETLKKTKEEIAEALESVGYDLFGTWVVNIDHDGKCFITLSIKPKEE